jgi:hypothetical protein
VGLSNLLYKETLAMKRVEFFTYKSKRILLIDFSNLKATDVPPVIAEAQQIIAQQPNGSVFTLTDLTQMGFSPEVAAAMKNYTLHNKPYVKAAAVVGASGLMSVVKGSVEKSSMRDLVNFETREEAQEWLVSQ